MQKEELRQELKHNILLMDGAMGTYYNHLHPEAGEAELANVEHPEWIQEIHKRYIEAGARIIRTNTFAVNHGLFAKEQWKDVIAMAVKNAREAIESTGCMIAGVDEENQDEQGGERFRNPAEDRKKVYIAGSIGPIRIEQEMEQGELFSEYRAICENMYAQGIRIFILETFADVELAKQIAGFIKRLSKHTSYHHTDTGLSAANKSSGDETADSEVFVQAQFSINRMGYTLYGQSAEKIVREVENCQNIDGVGFNCGIGAAHMNRQLEKLAFTKDIILSVLPNAGYEQGLRGREFLIDNPLYYAQTMEQVLAKGVNLIGGCCGTTPEHTKALARMLNGKTPVPKHMVALEQTSDSQMEDNAFIAKLNKGEKVYVVEIDSPFNGNGDKFLAGAKLLRENDVDLVTISDSPMARPRAEAFQMGIYIGNKTGVQVMPHVCCRDRNLIGLRSAMLGAHINGIRDMLIITGDPVGRDDRGTITSVFDVNSIRLMEYVKNMNAELFPEEPFYYGGALNYTGVNIDAIETRIRKKMEAGCSYFLTQPVYSDADIARVRELKERTGAKIIVGLMPLVSYKNAMFMKNEMPGIDVPDEVIQCYAPDMSREEAEETAVRVCVKIGEKVQNFADGYYLMTPFNRVGMVNRIIDELRMQDSAGNK